MNALLQKIGKALTAGLGVAMVALEPTYGKYAWYVAIPAAYTAFATFMSAPNVVAPTPTVTVHSSQETQQ